MAEPLKIATWNINGLKARLDFILHWLRARQPDVVGLQELKLTDEKFPHLEFEALGYHAVTYGQKSWNGVAILARDRPEVVQKGLPGEDDLGSRLITARTSGLTFTTVYCPNGKRVDHADYGRKLQWFSSLSDHFADLDADESAILCGDFNVVPTPLDSWSEDKLAGHIFHTPSERERFGAVLDRGFSDLFREKYPSEQQFSWWDYRAGAFHKRMGLRIDFLLATAPVCSRLDDVGIDREYRKKKDGLTASDHAPVWATLS